MALIVYNSLGKSKQTFSPINPPEVNLYSCGPTVYNRAHIGNLRSYLFADILYRTLKYKGYKPKWVMNITDIDDKTIKGTIEKFGLDATNEKLQEYTEDFTNSFLSDLKFLNIETTEIDFRPVTKSINEIQQFVIDLIDKGFAYQADDGSVYFSIEKYQQVYGDYGLLIGEKFIDGKKIGASATEIQPARVEVDEYDKDNLSDFALWKAHTENDGQIGWSNQQLIFGRPGWHIECSTINRLAFGDQTIDIHTGGVDLTFPHHTNEMAQSKALTGHEFVKYWLHSEHVLVDGKKMAKSLDNVLYLYDHFIVKEIDPLAYRYFLLQSNFKQTINFTWEAFESARIAYDKLKKAVEEIKKQISQDNNSTKKEKILLEFETAIDNNLNTAEALAWLWQLIKDKSISPENKTATIREMDKILGLKLIDILEETIVNANHSGIPAEISLLLEEREKARLNKDWSLADQIRDQISMLGYEVLDTDSGPILRKRSKI